MNRNILSHRRKSLLVALAVLLLLRSRLLEIPQEALVKSLQRRGLGRKLSTEELSQTLQQLYIKGKDGSKTLLVPYQSGISKVPIKSTPRSQLAADANRFPLVPSTHKPSLNKASWRQLTAILKIAFPTWHSKESGIIALHSFFLVLRTVLSVAVARLDGRLVRNIVSADGKGFLKGLGLWFALAVPSTYTNTMIHHLQAKLSLRMRTRLTRYTHDLYLSSAPDLRYYRIGQEGGLEGVDQYITSDISSFCNAFSQVYGNVLKPSLDLLLFTSQLSRTLGVRGTLLLFLNYYITARILRAVTPAFGRLAAVEARLEGEYRAGMGRVGRDSEEVAFYNGGGRERDILWRAYLRLIKHINSICKIRIAYEWTEDYVIKYLWSAAGYGLISIPVLLTRRKRHVGTQASTGSVSDERINDEVANRTETYISSRRLLLSLADAGGRLMYAYKDLLELAGLTTRLYALLSTLHNLTPLPEPTDSENVELAHVNVVLPQNANTTVPPKTGPPLVLVRDLSLKLNPGDHLMITGSNGVGKTSVARVIAGLWAGRAHASSFSRRDASTTLAASISRPHGKKGVFVVPQRSYMVSGSLLDQVIYPDSYPEFVESGRTEEELQRILEAVSLGYLTGREGGWGVRKEWRDVLSGGEKQRMAMARVLYHKPQFAVLDECTSAVSSDVEGRMYEHAKSLGITLITISLRPSLMKFHTLLLTINGDVNGTWTLSQLGTAEERMELDREIIAIEEKLKGVEGWERRVEELTKALSVQDA
ncbi:ABC transporter transmembrane region 2-domain-containing protein [Irpex rosettiformis]|uniref:ABC transporter transmembrane region 2-domain-containing protein n=1 Tax=Irpex rosettiformis TaxID=378272 RepID=A0ACB8U1W2_9APHY|nr:ABC transporter transmembrane region 2-domain-containing protein [Irpex rosettiformis]